MEKQTFYSLVEKPYGLNLAQIEELASLIERYPYFQSARSLLLQMLYHQSLDAFKKELARQALLIPDRRHLLMILNKPAAESKTLVEQPNVEVSADPAVADAKPIITDTLLGPKVPKKRGRPKKVKEYKDKNEPLFTIIENQGELEKTIESDNQADVKTDTDILELIDSDTVQGSNGIDLIEKFISEQPTIPRPAAPVRGETNEGVVDISSQSVAEPEELATEPLAQIYALQGYTDKAISVYEKLMLKYPEKSSYFADQIKKLKEER